MDNKLRTLEREAASGCEIAKAALEKAQDRADGFPAMGIDIDGEIFTVTDINRWNGLSASLEVEDSDGIRFEYTVFTDRDDACQATRDRWEEMAHDDPSEFRAMVGDETLVMWAMGQRANNASNLNDWLDLVSTEPEVEFAHYDHTERDVTRVGSQLREELEFTPTVAYRTN